MKTQIHRESCFQHKRQASGQAGKRNRFFRYPDGAVANTLAIGYCLSGYVGALALLAGAPFYWWPLAVLWLGHSLVVAAYLIHECTHGTLFSRQRHHHRLAVVLAWLTGACYGDFGAIREKHLRHHVERADIVALDPRALMARHPRLRRLVAAGQWAMLPAVEILMHLLVILYPFRRGGSWRQRSRVMAMLGLRIIYFAALATLGWQVIVGYGLAYLLFLQVMAFMDALQHTYEVRLSLAGPRARPTRSRDYEEANTYSNLLSRRFPALNLLVLNFCYHNIHHRRAAEPWHRLPRLHNEHYGTDPGPVVSPGEQCRRFFRQRLDRIADSAPAAAGAAGVSFLTPL